MTRLRWMLLGLALAAFALLVLRPRAPLPAGAPGDAGSEPEGLAALPIHELRHRNFAGGDEYLVRNLLAGPVEVRCAMAEAQNVESVPPLPRRLVLPALAERRLTELRFIQPGQAGGAAIICDAMVGDPTGRPDPAIVYALPFHRGTAFTLDQGFNGAYSHHDGQSRHALDFGVAEGTPVLAAREGVVMQVERNFRLSGQDAGRFGGRANFVRVLHADGSMALYAHLAAASVVPLPGNRVAVGAMLGKSGSTGFSTGPHLHFSVQANTGMALRSIPFRMAGVAADGSRLAAE